MPIDLTESRPQLSAELIEALRRDFGLITLVEPRDLGGSFSLNLLVDTPGGRYVARVHGSQMDAARLAAIQLVRRRLAGGGVPTVQPVPTRNGRPFVEIGGHLLEVERYVEHDAKMDTWRRLEIGLPSLGRTHSLLSSVPVGPAGRRAPIANHIEPDQAFAGTLRGVQRMRSWDLTAEEVHLAAAFEELARLVNGAERGRVENLPRQLVHGDFWDNNVLFRGEQVVLVADLDFMAERLRIDDLALSLFFANSSLGGDRLSVDRIRQLRALVDAYDSGLSAPLTTAERRALPPAIARNTLWSIGWWVPSLPDARLARKQAMERAVDVEWTLGLMRNVGEWQEGFSPYARG